MTLEAIGSVARPDFELGIDVRVGAATIAVTGDNGTGKTTLLRTIAGLERLRSGRVRLGPVVFDELSLGAFVPPHSRRVSMMFQDPLLLPFLNVVDNVAFPLRRAGSSVDVARAAACAALDRLGAANLARRDPSTLSGGEARRVALSRALVRAPSVILLDEPFSALDRRSRVEFRSLLVEAFADLSIPRLLVTHDDADIEAMCAGEIRVTRTERAHSTALGVTA